MTGSARAPIDLSGADIPSRRYEPNPAVPVGGVLTPTKDTGAAKSFQGPLPSAGPAPNQEEGSCARAPRGSLSLERGSLGL